jgi:hypothetical protein
MSSGGCGCYSQQCNLACPQYIYTQGNGTYYYYCNCCNVAGHPIVPCSNSSLPKTDCPLSGQQPDPNCFDLSNPPGKYPVRPRSFAGGDCDFYYNAWHTGTNNIACRQYRDGIARPARGDHLDEEIRDNNPLGLTISEPYYLSYTWQGVDHTVALYDFDDQNGVYRGLGIGQEVVSPLKPLSNGTQPTPHQVSEIFPPVPVANFPHYHQVTKHGSARVFHVALKQ